MEDRLPPPPIPAPEVEVPDPPSPGLREDVPRREAEDVRDVEELEEGVVEVVGREVAVGFPPLGESVIEDEVVGVDEVDWEGLRVPRPPPGERVAPLPPPTPCEAVWPPTVVGV